MNIRERVKNMIKSWLDIRPAQGQTFLINENIEYKVLCTKRWDNVEKGIFNEEVENHHFDAEKGHFESIYIHFFK